MTELKQLRKSLQYFDNLESNDSSETVFNTGQPEPKTVEIDLDISLINENANDDGQIEIKEAHNTDQPGLKIIEIDLDYSSTDQNVDDVGQVEIDETRNTG